MEKSELRKLILERRQALAPADRHRLSLAAQEALIGSPAFQAARSVLIYIAFRGEVETELIAAAALAAGKRLGLPRVIKQPRGLALHAYSGDPATLVRGAYGIPEPAPDWPVLAPAEIDLVVVAGVAFDAQGGRLGYGGGYYDRLLPAARSAGATLIGLAFGLQLVERVPLEPHDVTLDGVATELGYLLTRRD